jgi:hypothetical protein
VIESKERAVPVLALRLAGTAHRRFAHAVRNTGGQSLIRVNRQIKEELRSGRELGRYDSRFAWGQSNVQRASRIRPSTNNRAPNSTRRIFPGRLPWPKMTSPRM